MKSISSKFRRILRSLEQHLANQADTRQEKAINSHIASVSASIGEPRMRRSSTLPYRWHIAVAFASLASALVSLYAWFP